MIGMDLSDPFSDLTILDLTGELKQAARIPCGGGSFATVYKYESRAQGPLRRMTNIDFFAVKKIRCFLSDADTGRLRRLKEVCGLCLLGDSLLIRYRNYTGKLTFGPL